MNLVNPYYLVLSVTVILLLLLFFRRTSRLQKRFERYAEPQFMKYYFREQSAFWVKFKLLLSLLAIAAIIMALVRPQWDFEEKEFEREGMDIVFAIDVSKSMDARDIMPSRLLRALMQISGFLDKLKTDRIGIIAFAGVATLQCPLTDDYEAVRIVLNGLSSDTVERPGTDIGAALELANLAFNAASNANSIVLISDGEDLAGEAFQQAKNLKAKGIRVHTMGVGSPDGSLVTNLDTGQEVVSKLDEASLQKIAGITGGDYYRITPGGDEILLAIQRIYDSEETRHSNKRLNVMKEQYYLFAGIAILLLAVESLIDPRRRKRGLMAAENSNET